LRALLAFLNGGVAMTFGIAGLFFLRFWTRSSDVLFLAFAGAFWLLMLQAGTAMLDIPDEPWAWTYLLRVAAYLLIVVAILAKNRVRR